MTAVFKLGSRVRRRNYDGWEAPGCVMEILGSVLKVYWPDENLITAESPADLALYCAGFDTQPEGVAA
jgi:hypothetical protein